VGMVTQRNPQPIQNMKKVTTLQLVNDHGLSEQQLKFAAELSAKFPVIAEEAKRVLTAEAEIKDKYFTLCDEVRKSGLNSRELTLLLQSTGFHKVRISEIKKVISVDDETWEKYRRKEFGFKATLKLARGGDAAVEEAQTPPVSETQGSQETEASAPAVLAVVANVDPILPKLAKMLKMHKLAPGKHTALIDVDDYAVQILFTVKGKN